MQTSSVSFLGDLFIPGHRVGGQDLKEHAPADETVETYKLGSVEPAELAKLQSTLAEHNISLKFSKDETTKALVVEMIDDSTGEELRQFPTEVSLKLEATFMRLQGQFVNNLK